MDEARGIEQDIDRADALGHGGDRGAVAHVELCDLGHAFACQRCQPLFVDVGGEHRGALAREGERAGAANSGGARGHECAFAFQAVRHVILLGSSTEASPSLRSEAKQSRSPAWQRLDCFVASAPRHDGARVSDYPARRRPCRRCRDSGWRVPCRRRSIVVPRCCDRAPATESGWPDAVAARLLERGAALRQFPRPRSACWRVPLRRSMRTRSPVRSNASPPPAAASGEALRMDGEPDVPDWRPSPMQGSAVMPRLIRAAGGCMLTTSARAGIADRSGAAHDQQGVLVDRRARDRRCGRGSPPGRRTRRRALERVRVGGFDR